MEGQKSEPTTTDNRQANKLQTTQTNRQMDGIFPFLLSASYLRAYLRACASV